MHFSKTAQLHIFNRPNVARHELSYTKSEYDCMKLVVGEDVFAVRAGQEGLRENLVMILLAHLHYEAMIDNK